MFRIRFAAAFFLAVSLGFGLPPVSGLDAVPQARAQANTPLLIIRFNQKRVYFEPALTRAVGEAQGAKADVVYEVVSLVPPSAPDAQRRLDEVLATMVGLGVPGARVRVSQQAASTDSQEVHIYVR
jgi:hypothetical protein